jgi:Mn2+/Fe2+ NRAMP family transporter
MHKLKTFVASILPGIFIIGYNVGTGSITSMSKAGANFGYGLLWTVALSCLVTYYLINLFSRYTMVTGKTFIEGLKEDIHPALALFLIVTLSLIILAALMGVLGIIADVMHAWTGALFKRTLPLKLWAVLIALLVYFLIWVGNYPFFEKVLAILVSAMGVAFIASMFISFPSLAELAKGFVPRIPEVAPGSDNGPLVIISGMVGTTVSVFAFIIRSQIVKETGWTLRDSREQRRDAMISASMMFVISSAVIITAASTLYVKGIRMNHIVDMIPILEPLAGKSALGVFVIGILAAGLSSHLPNLLVIPWLIMDYRDEPRNTKTPKYRLILFLLTLISMTGIFLGFKPIFIMIISQACIAVVLPVTIAAMFYLSTKKSIMKGESNRWLDISILSLIMLFSIYMSILGIKGLIVDLSALLT